MKTVCTDILGVDYEIEVGKRKELGLPKSLVGQCCPYLHKIKVLHSNELGDTKEEIDCAIRGTVAHEIFHAFCKESGLDLDKNTEEKLALWYEEQWRKMSNCILDTLEKVNLDI